MRWRLLAFTCFTTGALACSSNSPAGSPPGASDASSHADGSTPGSSGGEAGDSGGSADDSAAGSTDAGNEDASGEAGQGTGSGADSAPESAASSGDDAASGSDDGGSGPVFPPVDGGMHCSPTAQWSAGTLLSLSTSVLDRFGAITPDELTIAWMTPDGDAGAVGTVHYADRSTASDSFGADQTLAAFGGYFALGPVALSPDGLTMIVVRADLQGFGAATRASRGAAFGSPDEAPFSSIDLNHADIPVTGSVMDDPVFAQDGRSLLFTDLAPTTTNSVTSLDLVGGSWTNRDTIVAGALQVSGTHLRRPTGISSDRLTLFFYDEVASIERAIWRTTATGTFTQAEDVGPLLYAQPNAACTRLYYSAQGASSVDLFYSDTQ